jgi:diaminohydroxyphosphoribosylaminopyrimidine deaminase/5-amino-6-(5-phosphoribosylamino)uracil reductase
VQSVLVEAGPGLATALLRSGLVDRLRWFVAPKIVGAGTPAVGSLGVEAMADALAFANATWETVGPDALLTAWLREP